MTSFHYCRDHFPVYFTLPTSAELRSFNAHYDKIVRKFIQKIKKGELTGDESPLAIFDLDFGLTIGELSLLIVNNYSSQDMNAKSTPKPMATAPIAPIQTTPKPPFPTTQLPSLSSEELKMCLEQEDAAVKKEKEEKKQKKQTCAKRKNGFM